MIEPSGVSPGGARSALLTRWVARSGLVLAVFVVLHVAASPLLLSGGRRVGPWLIALHGSPLVGALELALIGLPLVVHGVCAFALALTTSAPGSRDASALLRRAGALACTAFVAAHLWQLRIALALGRLDADDVYWALAASLSSTNAAGVPLVAAGYLVGLAATAHHFSTGLRSAWEQSGRLHSTGARQRADLACTSLGFLLFVAGALSVLYLATGSKLVGQPTHDASAAVASVIREAACRAVTS